MVKCVNHGNMQISEAALQRIGDMEYALAGSLEKRGGELSGWVVEWGGAFAGDKG